MNLPSILFWGFVATLVLSTALSASQQLGFSRLNLPFIIGAMVTPDRRRASVFGFLLHAANGWLAALVYALAFESWGRATWWLGGAIGVVHGLFVLLLVLPLLPGVHPRMASEHQGPEPTRELEPPGVMGLNYGRFTPFVVLAGHVLFGAILGGFYQLAPR
jgi:hypothetical protein